MQFFSVILAYFTCLFYIGYSFSSLCFFEWFDLRGGEIVESCVPRNPFAFHKSVSFAQNFSYFFQDWYCHPFLEPWCCKSPLVVFTNALESIKPLMPINSHHIRHLQKSIALPCCRHFLPPFYSGNSKRNRQAGLNGNKFLEFNRPNVKD